MEAKKGNDNSYEMARNLTEFKGKKTLEFCRILEISHIWL